MGKNQRKASTDSRQVCDGEQVCTGLLEGTSKPERKRRMGKGEGLNRDRLERAEHGGMFLQSQTPEAEAVGGLQVAGQFGQQRCCIQK